MFINELEQPQLLVIYPGRFQPFHKGHYAVYNFLTSKFGGANVFIATSNKTDNLKSPFTFTEKSYFMQLTGVPAGAIIECAEPYKIESILNTGRVQVNPKNTVVIFAVSEKDMAEDPRFKSWTKKDGSPGYFQPLENIKDTKSLQEHGYIMTVPTYDFNVLEQPMRSGTELRKMYTAADEQQRKLIIKDLFGKYTQEAEHILSKLAGTAAVEPPRPTKLPKTAKPAGGLETVKEEAAGVGVVKGSNDPRYMMATMGDQNDVDGNTLNKEMQAYGLVGRASPGGKTQQRPVNGSIGKGIKESELDEKSVSKAQFRTMAAAAHNPEFAKKVGIKQSVAKEFHGADRKQNYKSLPKTVDEADDSTWLVKDPESGEMGIRPPGGFGTWTEPTLITSLIKDLQTIEGKVQAKNATDAEYLLYRKYSTVKAKLQALARYQEFVAKNGKRPIKLGREIELPSKEDN